jgi:hypothetical protein
MGNYSFFVGCASREAALQCGLGAAGDDAPELEAKYYIPLFWLAAFGSEDCLVVRRPEEQFTLLCCLTTTGVARLRRRRRAILDLVGERFVALYDGWVELVSSRYSRMILLRTDDLFSMSGFEQSDTALRAALEALTPADRGEPLSNRRALEGFCHLDGPDAIGDHETALETAERARVIFTGQGTRGEWPPPPNEEEIAWLDLWATRDWSTASASDLQAHLERVLVEQVAGVWAGAIPPIVLLALAGRGDLDAVRTIARRLAPGEQAALLAWSAWLDPDSRSRAATRAAGEALRKSRHLAVLALVPLEDPAVLALARARRGEEEQAALALRLGERDAAIEHLFGDTQIVIESLLAERLDAIGRREDAEAALARALATPCVEESALLVVLRAVQRLGAYHLVPIDSWPAAMSLTAAFLAGRAGEEAVAALLGSLEPSSYPRSVLLSAAVLGRGEAPAAWREELASIDDAAMNELYEEGDLSAADVQACRFGKAAVGAGARAAVNALVLESISGAHEAARAFTDTVQRGIDAPVRDDEALARAQERFEQLLGEARSGKLSAKAGLAKVARQARALGEAGGAVEGSRLVADLEAVWGPAASFLMAVERRSGASFTLEILGSAAGRAREAAEMDAAHPGARTPSRALVVAGLVRDGEVEKARALLGQLFGEMLDSTALVRLAPAVRLDPAAASRLHEALAKETASLPGTPEAVAEWLRALQQASHD